MAEGGGGTGWRDSYRPARLFVIDARIVLLILPTVVHLRWYTILPTLAVAAVLYYFEKRREMLVPGAVRMVRWWMAGDDRPPGPPHKRRGTLDLSMPRTWV